MSSWDDKGHSNGRDKGYWDVKCHFKKREMGLFMSNVTLTTVILMKTLRTAVLHSRDIDYLAVDSCT